MEKCVYWKDSISGGLCYKEKGFLPIFCNGLSFEESGNDRICYCNTEMLEVARIESKGW
jgi:hypothetical protein